MPLIQVNMAAGRSAEQKRALLHAVTQAVHESIGSPIAAIHVWINEYDETELIAGGEILADRSRRTVPGG